MFSLALSILTTLYFASPFTQQALAAGCWYGCTDGPQGDRLGCSVTFHESAGNRAFGIYKYTCGTEVIYCTYKYDCGDGSPPEGGGEY